MLSMIDSSLCNYMYILGNKERSFNPTEYREPALYEAFFRSAVLPTDDPEEVYGFDLVLQRQLMSYYKVFFKHILQGYIDTETNFN